MNVNTIFKAIKLIYPEIEGGYAYWENQTNPAEGLVWENTQYPKPNWEDIQDLIPQIELQEAKNKKATEIRAIKETELYKPVSYMGRFFAASERASGNIIATLLLNGTSINWLDANGDLVVMTKTEFEGLGIVIKDQRSNAYFIEAQRYKQIAEAETIEEVEAIEW